MTTRTLELTHEEIELIEAALNQVTSLKMSQVSSQAGIMTKQEREAILQSSNRFDTLRAEIAEGEKDI